jgi:hypothetical protein
MKRTLTGATVGALATMMIGFSWGGWMLGTTAKEMAEKSSSNAVVAALAPICVDQFEHAPEAPTKLVELQKVSSSQQVRYIEKGGWSIMPGSKLGNSLVAAACAAMLITQADNDQLGLNDLQPLRRRPL